MDHDITYAFKCPKCGCEALYECTHGLTEVRLVTDITEEFSNLSVESVSHDYEDSDNTFVDFRCWECGATFASLDELKSSGALHRTGLPDLVQMDDMDDDAEGPYDRLVTALQHVVECATEHEEGAIDAVIADRMVGCNEPVLTATRNALAEIGVPGPDVLYDAILRAITDYRKTL